MKGSTTSIFKILSAVMLGAVLLYFGVQVYRYFTESINTTPVYTSSEEEVIEINGYLIRDEETFHSDAATLDHALGEGERAGKGQTIATAYPDGGALSRVEQLDALKLRLEQLSFALVSYLDPDAALKLDTSITGDILALRQTLSGGDYSAAESDLAQLKAAVLKRDHSYTSQEDIQAEIKSVESDIQSQKAKLSGARSVTAKASGTYSAVCDGYETVLTEEFLEELTPSKLDGVRAAEEQSNVGKLIYGDTWYYAVVLPEEQAAELKTMGSINVRLAKGFDQTIRMSVESVSRPDKGRCAVVLSSTRYLAQTTLLRHQAADAVLHTYEGLRVPADALRVSEDGVTGVYCVDGENAAFRPVTLVYQGEGYALVTPAEGAGDTRTLRAGDQVIATSGQLHDGKVIR